LSKQPEPATQKSRSRRKWLAPPTFLAGAVVYWAISASLDSVKAYFFTNTTDISELTVFIPITAVVAFVALTIFTIRYLLTQPMPGILRRIPPARYVIAYYVELPLATVLLLYSVPGLYSIYQDIVTCPRFSVCYWSIGAMEWVIMIHLGTIFAGVLTFDYVRYWLKDRKNRSLSIQ